MNAYINEYTTRRAQNRNAYQPRPRIKKYKNSFLYGAGKLWNALPPSVKESPDLDTFKQRYKALNSISRQNVLIAHHVSMQLGIFLCFNRAL